MFSRAGLPSPLALAAFPAPRAAALARAWRSCSFCFPVEYLMRFQFPQCPLIRVQFLAACFQPRARVNFEGFFPFVKLPVSSDLVSLPWLGEPSGHKHVGFARNSCPYPGKNPTKQGSLFTLPSLCHSLPKKCKPGWAAVLQQASLTTHL